MKLIHDEDMRNLETRLFFNKRVHEEEYSTYQINLKSIE